MPPWWVLLGLDELKLWRGRQHPDFRPQTVIKLKPIQSRRVEIIMDVLRQIDANDLDSEAEAGGPLLRDSFQIFWRQPMITRVLEDFGDCCPSRPASACSRIAQKAKTNDFPVRATHSSARSRVEVARAVDLQRRIPDQQRRIASRRAWRRDPEPSAYIRAVRPAIWQIEF